MLVIYLGHLSQLHFGGELTRPRSLQVALCPYDPSETAALAFTAMIAIAAFLHLVLMFPCSAWFPIPTIIGSVSKLILYFVYSFDY